MFLHASMVYKVPMFKECERSFIKSVVMRLRPQIAFPKELVCSEGDVGKHMFFIESGHIEVMSSDLQITYACLGPGAFVGEIAILTGLRRTASIMTRSMCKFLLLTKLDFEDVLLDFQEHKLKFREIAKQRIVDKREQDKKKREHKRKKSVAMMLGLPLTKELDESKNGPSRKLTPDEAFQAAQNAATQLAGRGSLTAGGRRGSGTGGRRRSKSDSTQPEVSRRRPSPISATPDSPQPEAAEPGTVDLPAADGAFRTEVQNQAVLTGMMSPRVAHPPLPVNRDDPEFQPRRRSKGRIGNGNAANGSSNAEGVSSTPVVQLATFLGNATSSTTPIPTDFTEALNKLTNAMMQRFDANEKDLHSTKEEISNVKQQVCARVCAVLSII